MSRLVDVLTAQDPAARAGDPAVTCNLGTIPAGRSATVTIVVNIPSSATGAVSNTASVTSPDDEVAGNNSDTETTAIALDVALSVTKSVDPTTPFQQGMIADYLVTVSHIGGTSNANNVTATDPLDPRLTFVSAGSSIGCSSSGTPGVDEVVTCNGGSIPPGGMVTFRIRVMIGN